MADAFSTPAEHALEHEVEVEPQSMGDATTSMSVEDAFEVDASVAEILEKGYKTVRGRDAYECSSTKTSW